MTASKIFLYFCLSFIGGIFISSTLDFLPGSKEILLLPGLISGILLISVFWRYKKPVVIGFSILFLVLGIWRYQQVESGIMNNELRRFNDLDQKIAIIGIISKEPGIRESSTKLVIKPEKIEFASGELQDGLILISDMVHSYTEFIATRLNKEELSEFNRKLYE